MALLARVLPPLELLDDVMYKAIALGFAAFTIATILVRYGRPRPWGGYWSWDPKGNLGTDRLAELCGLAAPAVDQGWRGTPMAWWAVIGLLVTCSLFLGSTCFCRGCTPTARCKAGPPPVPPTEIERIPAMPNHFVAC